MSNNRTLLLKEQVSMVASNLKRILSKQNQDINNHQRQFIVNLIKKITFVKEYMNIQSPSFTQIALSVQLQTHKTQDILFEKNDVGQYFYIVIQGSYYIRSQGPSSQRKNKSIIYYAGDSFGEISLIFGVPRGVTIVAQKPSSILKIPKNDFNSAGDFQKSILFAHHFFKQHPYFLKENQFMLQIVSALSKTQSFKTNDIIIEEAQMVVDIIFFVKGEAQALRTLKLKYKDSVWEQTIQMCRLRQSSVFGEYFYLREEPSRVRVVGVNGGKYIKVSFKDDIKKIETHLYQRLRLNALRFPSDEQLFEGYKLSLAQKLKQLRFMAQYYGKKNNAKNQQLAEVRSKLAKIQSACLISE